MCVCVCVCIHTHICIHMYTMEYYSAIKKKVIKVDIAEKKVFPFFLLQNSRITADSKFHSVLQINSAEMEFPSQQSIFFFFFFN